MRQGVRFFLTLIILVLVVAAFAWATDRPPWRIGVLFWSDTIAGQVAMRRGLEREAERIMAETASGSRSLQLIPFVAGDGGEGIERQIKQMRDLIAEKVDLIIVQPTDNAALGKPLREANAAGIPVVAYDQYIDGGELAVYLTSDNAMAGFLDGEYTASAFPATKTLSIVLVEYPHVSSTVERVNGFLDALKSAGQPFRILKTYIAVEPVGGKRAGRQILADFPATGSIDVVFTVNDGGGLNVVNELASAGRSEIFVVTIDGDPESVENIRQKRLTRIDAAQFCAALGASSLRAAWLLLQGVKVPNHLLLPTFPITRETIDRYRGWMGEVPGAFEKPWKSSRPRWENHLSEVDRVTGERKPFSFPAISGASK